MRGDILYTKGLMDKAVFMAAFTADPKWKKQYEVHHRNMLIARDCDVMMAFILNGIESKGSMSAIKKAKKLNKPVTIIT